MARRKIIYSNEYPYHITARCINREWFDIPKNYCYGIYINVLRECKKRFSIEIVSFVLMDNHFHMIVKSPKVSISVFLRYFMTETARGIRVKSERINQVYGSRNYKTLINDPRYLAHCLKYIARNPVAAGISDKVETYKWSSFSNQASLMNDLAKINMQDKLYSSLPKSRKDLLTWLNTPLPKELEKQSQRALKKSIFEFGTVRSTRAPFNPNQGLAQ